jgi:hypothetical protein
MHINTRWPPRAPRAPPPPPPPAAAAPPAAAGGGGAAARAPPARRARARGGGARASRSGHRAHHRAPRPGAAGPHGPRSRIKQPFSSACMLSAALLLLLPRALLLVVATAADSAAAPASAQQAPCRTALDCTLSGECVAGQCVCDPPWRGPSCATLKRRCPTPPHHQVPALLLCSALLPFSPCVHTVQARSARYKTSGSLSSQLPIDNAMTRFPVRSLLPRSQASQASSTVSAAGGYSAPPLYVGRCAVSRIRRPRVFLFHMAAELARRRRQPAGALVGYRLWLAGAGVCQHSCRAVPGGDGHCLPVSEGPLRRCISGKLRVDLLGSARRLPDGIHDRPRKRNTQHAELGG